MDLIPNKNNGYNGGGAPEELNFRRNVLGVGGQQEGKILSSKGFLRFSIIAFRVSLGVLFLAVAGAAFFYVMSYQTKGKVVSGQNDLENRRQELQGESFVKHRDNVRQIEAMKKMIGKRVYASNLLNEIEKNTVQGNAWGSFSLNTTSGICKMGGRAPSYSLVAKQAVAFKRVGFSNIDFNDLQLNKEGGVSFDAEFVFGSAFKKKPATLSE